jgi:shikimate kinase
MNKNNVVLIGFMGTGKSTVGQLAAQRLGWTFVDSDDWIVERAGKTIPDIFAQEGEAEFRRLETEALAVLLGGVNVVLATGGGAVLLAGNRQLMLDGGLVVALTAPQAVIVKRVSGDRNRPLLQGDAERRVADLMEARRGAYDFAELTIDTAELDPPAVAERIVQAVRGL